MAGNDLTISLIMKLVNQVTGPAKGVINTVKRIGEATQNAGRTGVAWSNKQIAANHARKSALQGEAFATAASAVALYQALKPAIEFETAMAGVKKVLDFDTPQGIKDMESSILALTTSGALPVAAQGIAEIIEAAGQAGVVDKALPDDDERAKLIAFAKDAAQMGVAFDLSAEQSGQAMAQWYKALGLPRERVIALGDAINHLSNNMNATAPGLVDIVRRQGAVAKSAGLLEHETAALAAAILSGGAAPEVAATGMKNFLSAMTKGEAVTKRQRKVFKELGLDGVELAKRMQVDAKGAIIQVMEALAKLPKHAQNASLGMLFGEESKGAIAPLLTNVKLLHEAFGPVAEPSQYAGSMLAEYQVQAATTSNALKLTINFVNGLAIAIGSILLPEINALFASIQPMIASITDWAKAHPELITFLFRAVAGLLAFKMASIALRFGVFSALTPILHLIRAGSWMLVLLPKVIGGVLGLLNPLRAVRTAMLALRVAFISTGIGALLVGIAMAGMWIYNNWQGLETFFVGFWSSFRDALGPSAPMLEGISAALSKIWSWFSNLVGPMDATEANWLSWGENAGSALGGIIARVSEWTGINSGLILSVAKLYAGFFVLRLIWGLPMSPLRAAGRLLLWIGKVPLMGLLSGVKLLAVAFLRLGLLAMANPIGLVIAGVAALAFVIYQNWDQVVNWLIGKVEAVRSAFEEGILKGVFKLVSEFNPWTLAREGAEGLFTYLTGWTFGDVFGAISRAQPFQAAYASADAFFQKVTGWDLSQVFSGVVNILPFGSILRSAYEFYTYVTTWNFAQIVGDIVAKFSGINLVEAGANAITSLWQGMKSILPKMIASIKAKLAGLLPNWAQSFLGTTNSETKKPGRDRGGPVRPGIPYIVGERHPEIFVPGVSGSILPARALKSAMAASAMALPAAALPSEQEASARFDQRPAITSAPTTSQVSRGGDTNHFNIYPSPGMSPDDIARAVAQELARREADRSADLHDGVDY